MNFVPAISTSRLKSASGALALGLLFPALLAAQVSDTLWMGQEGRWSSAGNWSGGMPVNSRNAVIEQGVVEVDTEVQARLLQLATAPGSVAGLRIVKGGVLNVGNAGQSLIGTGAGATGSIIQTGGAVSFPNFLSLGGTGSQETGGNGSYTIGDGMLSVGQTLRLGYNTTGNSDSRFVMTGGRVTLGGVAVGAARYAGGSGAPTNVARLGVSGGTLVVSGDYTHGQADTRGAGRIEATTEIIGRSASVTIGGNLVLNHNKGSASTLSFRFDEDGVGKLAVTGGATLAGALRVGFQGGAALFTAGEFTLIEASKGHVAGSFATLPDTALWEIATTAETVSVRPAEAGRKGGILFSRTGLQGAAFAASPAGFVTIDRLEGGRVELYLAASAGAGKTTADLVAYLNRQGVTAAPMSDGPYTILLETRAPNGSACFGWDLRDFNRGANLSAVSVSPAGAR